ncbi:hypothetical protein AEGHOMDF_5118 [Methylobacterium soli]|nr:hypothetical protein AEGHOMDF_5118 [Methylobacterium soli]
MAGKEALVAAVLEALNASHRVVRTQPLAHREREDAAEEPDRPRGRAPAAFDDGAAAPARLNVEGGLTRRNVVQKCVDMVGRYLSHPLAPEKRLNVALDTACVR